MPFSALRSGGSSRAENAPPRPGEKAGFDEQRHCFALRDRLAVEALDREALLRAAGTNIVDQSGEDGPEPALVGIAERNERAAATLDEQRGLAAEQDDLGAGDAGCPCPRPFPPRQARAARPGPAGRGGPQ